MPVSSLTCSDQAIAQIRQALMALRRSDSDFTPGKTVRLSGAVPLYRPLQGLEKDLDLGSLRLVGHRYLVFAGDDTEGMLTADIEPEGPDGRVKSIAQAQPALLDSLREADAAGEGDFELRMIDVPAACASALWLHGERSLFIDLDGEGEPQVLEPAHYFERINARLADRRARWEQKPRDERGK